MAAGNARRFGQDKLCASLHGRSLIRRALEAVPAERCDAVAVVTQRPEVVRLAGDFRFTAVLNRQPEMGLSRSVKLGLSAIGDCDGACFLVADQPLLRRESVAALLDLWRAAPEQLAALGHDGVRGNPCVFPARLFPELMALTGDAGGAAVIRRHADLLNLLNVPAEELWDVDTPEALEKLAAMEPGV